MKKLYKYIVLVAGIITAFLIIALAASVTKQWVLGAIVGVAITAIFGGIIAFGVYDMRAREPLVHSTPSMEEIVIHLTHPHPRLSFPMKKFFITIAAVMGAIDFILIVNEIGPSQLTEMFVAMNLLFLSMAALIVWIKTAPLNAARELVNKYPPRKFILNSKGLEVPLELLTIPAFNIALREGKASIFIPWNEVLAFEAHRQRGSSPRQFALKTGGETEKYGGLMGVFGVICDTALVAQESKILASARRYLHNTLSVHFDSPQ